jgi:NADPH:quinone reductase-like Zn-dependent oxidoreductase
LGGISSTIGIWKDGGWAQYCKLAAEQVHKVPDHITLEQGNVGLSNLADKKKKLH